MDKGDGESAKRRHGFEEAVEGVGAAERERLIESAGDVLGALFDALRVAREDVAGHLKAAETADSELRREVHRFHAAQIAPAVTSEFRDAASRIVETVALAICDGDPSDVIWLASELELRRSRRRWLAACERACGPFDAGRPPLPEEHVKEVGCSRGQIQGWRELRG